MLDIQISLTYSFKNQHKKVVCRIGVATGFNGDWKELFIGPGDGAMSRGH